MNESYVRGFMSKCAEYGITRGAAVALLNTTGIYKKADKIDELARYAEEHPVVGGMIAGSRVPVNSSVASSTSMGGSSGDYLSAPVADVIAPFAGSSAASSGGDFGESRASTDNAIRGFGRQLGGWIGSSAGGLSGAIASPFGASVGLSLGTKDHFKMVEEQELRKALKKLYDEREKVQVRLDANEYGFDQAEDAERLRSLESQIESLQHDAETLGKDNRDEMRDVVDEYGRISKRLYDIDPYGKTREGDDVRYDQLTNDISYNRGKINRAQDRTDWESALRWVPSIFK